MLKLLCVFLGGGLGSSLRWFISSFACKYLKHFPPCLGTFLVNILGSFILGFLFYLFLNKININEEIRLLLTVGFCGGLTTFSTFALENYIFISQGEILKSIFYILTAVFFTLLFTFLGVYFAKQF